MRLSCEAKGDDGNDDVDDDDDDDGNDDVDDDNDDGGNDDNVDGNDAKALPFKTFQQCIPFEMEEQTNGEKERISQEIS